MRLFRVGVSITLPASVDHGGLRHGDRLGEHDPQWSRGGLDLVTLVTLGDEEVKQVKHELSFPWFI